MGIVSRSEPDSLPDPVDPVEVEDVADVEEDSEIQGEVVKISKAFCSHSLRGAKQG